MILPLEIFVCFTINPVGTLSRGAYATYIALLFVCEGAHYVIFPTFISRVYGPE